MPLTSHCDCSPGKFVIDHLDNGTGRYTVIDRSHSTTINISRFEDGGIYRFYCNGSTLYCIGSSSYCYFIIAGMLVLLRSDY